MYRDAKGFISTLKKEQIKMARAEMHFLRAIACYRSTIMNTIEVLEKNLKQQILTQKRQKCENK
jgi:hypothetical protein